MGTGGKGGSDGYSSGLRGAVLVEVGTSPSPEGWPAPAPRDSELDLPLNTLFLPPPPEGWPALGQRDSELDLPLEIE